MNDRARLTRCSRRTLGPSTNATTDWPSPWNNVIVTITCSSPASPAAATDPRPPPVHPKPLRFIDNQHGVMLKRDSSQRLQRRRIPQDAVKPTRPTPPHVAHCASASTFPTASTHVRHHLNPRPEPTDTHPHRRMHMLIDTNTVPGPPSAETNTQDLARYPEEKTRPASCPA